MPKFPRNVSQAEAVRALIRGGGVEVARKGKGSHRWSERQTDNGSSLPYHLKTGPLRDMMKEAGFTVDEFIELL